MKIKLTSGLNWDKQHCDAGTILEVNDTDGAWIVSRGKGIPVDEGTKTTDRSVDTDSLEKRVTKKKVSKKKASKKAD